MPDLLQRRCQPGVFAPKSADLLSKIAGFRFGKGLRQAGKASGFDTQKKRKGRRLACRTWAKSECLQRVRRPVANCDDEKAKVYEMPTEAKERIRG